MFGRISLAISTLWFALAPVTPALAEGLVTLEGDVKVVRQVEENGTARTIEEEPSKVVPGDRLIFTTSYANDTGETVDDFVITNPLPDAVALASDGEFDVSIDGGKTYAPLDTLVVADGSGNSRGAELTDVTHIRWTLPTLAPGAQGKVTYFAVVR